MSDRDGIGWISFWLTLALTLISDIWFDWFPEGAHTLFAVLFFTVMLLNSVTSGLVMAKKDITPTTLATAARLIDTATLLLVVSYWICCIRLILGA